MVDVALLARTAGADAFWNTSVMFESLSLLQPWSTGYRKVTEFNTKAKKLDTALEAALFHATSPG